MSTSTHDKESEYEAPSVKYIPVDIHGNRIIWEDNPAYLSGALYEASEYYKRTGAFMALIEDGAVPLSNGRLAIDHPSAIQFTSGRVVDATSYDFYNPCPPTSQRIAIYDAARTSAGKATFVVQKAPDDIARDFQVAKYTVSKEDRDFHTSLLCIVGNGQLKNSFTLKSGGSGRALIPLLCAYEKKSTPTDRALVKTELVNFEKAGLQGELNLESFNLHYDDYEKLVRRRPPGIRPDAEETIEYLQNIIYKDPSWRDLFENKMAIATPSDLDGMLDSIRDMLRGRKVKGQLDDATAGATRPLHALTVQQVRDLARIPASMLSPQQSIDLDHAKRQQALVAAPDPRFQQRAAGKGDGRGKGDRAGRGRGGGKAQAQPPAEKGRVEPPRDENGRVIRWIEGMGFCSCAATGKVDGKHLFRDCETDGKPPDQVAKVADHLCETSADDGSISLDADLAEQLQAFAQGKQLAFDFPLPPSHSAHVAESMYPNFPPLDSGDPDDLVELQSRGAKIFIGEQTELRQLGGQHDTLAPVGFFSVNVGPCKGVYHGTWKEASDYVTGFKGGHGVTNCKKFQTETDALAHCRTFSGLPLVNYVLTDTRGSTGVPLGTFFSQSGTAGGPAPPAAPAAPSAVQPAPPEPLVEAPALRLSAFSRAQAFLQRHQFIIFAGVLGLLVGIFCTAAFAHLAPPAATLPAAAQPLSLAGSLRDVPPADHDALTVRLHHSPASDTDTGWRKLRLFLLVQGILSLCATVGFLWPSEFWYVAFVAPWDFAKATALVAATPFMAVAPWSLRLANAASSTLGLGDPMQQGVASMNYLRRCLPVLVFLGCALSSACFAGTMASSPVTSPPSVCPLPANLAGFTPALLNIKQPQSGAPSVVTADLPYAGKWVDPRSHGVFGCDVNVYDAGVAASAHVALVSASEQAAAKSSELRLPVFCATPDSGASASLTHVCSYLVDTKPCDEVFGGANGHVARATTMGNMPVITRTTDGTLVRFAFSNVRCVPKFKYTLLSVKQLWEEQNIDARFADLNHLQLPTSAGNYTIPYDRTLKLSTLVMVSEGALAARTRRPSGVFDTVKSLALSSVASSNKVSEQRALAGFHAIKSTSHIEHMSAAQASELMHRRLHLGVDNMRNLPHTTSDAPKNLSRAHRETCVHCAAAQIKKTSHSGNLRTPVAEPGTLHIDLKEYKLSIGGFRYVAFFIDEHTRYVFAEFLKNKSDVYEACMRVHAKFNATLVQL